MPIMVMKEIVKLKRKFLSGSGSEGRKIACDSWKKICESREV